MSEVDLQSLVDDHYGRIHRAAVVMTGNVCEADDLTQETFLHAIQSLGRFRGGSRIETWLYAILINQHRRRLRAGRRRQRRLLRWFSWAWTPPSAAAPSEPMEMEEWRNSIWRHVAELPEPQQHALVLRYAEELPLEEIAQVLNCPVGTVKSRLHHALAALRRRLSDEEPTEDRRRDHPLLSADLPSFRERRDE